MDSYSRERERSDVAAHQWPIERRSHTASGDDHFEVASVAASEGHPAKIRYVVRIPAFKCVQSYRLNMHMQADLANLY